MRPRFGVVTLGVADPGRARAFYEALGWRGSAGVGGIVFLVGNSVLNLDPAARRPGRALCRLARPREVEDLLARVAAAGGAVSGPPVRAPWGALAATFADPDGNLWEVEHDPDLPEEARLSLGQL